MSVLVACEFSSTVRDAFNAVGCDAWSCDLLPSEGRAGNHLVGDVRWALEGRLDKYPMAYDIRTGRQALYRKWDLLIHHTPCTYATNAGVRWLYKNGRGSERDEQRWRDMEEGARFFRECQDADVQRIAGENPIPHRYALELMGPYTQIIQPWWFGHGETKATCLWLKNLPPLVPTDVVSGREPRVHHASPGPERWKERSRTLKGIARAMADQWGRWQTP